MSKRAHKGFTLIEFVVIISIFAIMAAVALFNFQGFRSNVALNNMTHDIALTIRQAQVFGWSTQTYGLVSDVDSNNVQQKQGVFFKYNENTQSFGNEFVLYSKENPLGALDGAHDDSINSVDRVVDTIKMQGVGHISAIRTASSRSDLTALDLSGNPIGSTQSREADISIAFSRPRPEALFYSGGNPIDAPFLGIYVRGSNDANDNRVRVITISQFGEINVQ